jgi:hypothetical protein
MIIENLPSLQIHRLTEAQYQKLVDADKVNDKALYLVPDDSDLDINLVQELTSEAKHDEIPSARATVEYVEAKVPKFTTDTDLNDPDADLGSTIATAQMMKTYVEENTPTVVDDLSIATFGRDQKVPSVQATRNYVDGEIAALIGDEDRYPKALDTINEISAAIKENVETLDILNEAITSKVNQTDFNSYQESNTQTISNLNTALSTKVNKDNFDTEIAKKLDITIYNTEIGEIQNTLNTKANAAELTTLSQNLSTLGNQKADISYIDEQISTRATKEEVNGKVNQTTFDTTIGTINQTLNSQTTKNEEIDGSINALDDKIDATNKEVAKKIDSSKITLALSSASKTDEVPSAKTVFDYVNTSVVPDIVINPDIWTLGDGWHYISSGFFAKKEHYVELASEALVFVYSNNHQADYCNFYGWERQGNTFTGSVTLASGGAEGEFILRTIVTDIVDGGRNSDIPTARAVDKLIEYQIEYNAPDWLAVEGSPGYIANKPFTTNDPDTGEEVVKIESQYVETVTKVEDTTAQANEIPTVSAVQELIQQAIDDSLYIDEEDYV